jgi:hypothetical protein
MLGIKYACSMKQMMKIKSRKSKRKNKEKIVIIKK